MFGAVAFLAIGALVARLWSVQLVHGSSYRQAAQQNTSRVVLRPAPRGRISDARGRVLVETGAESVVVASPRALGNTLGTRWRPDPNGLAVLDRLASVVGTPVGRLLARMRLGLARSPYASPVVARRLSQDRASYLLERARAFPGLRVESLPARSYPQGAVGGEFLGLVGEISPGQLREPRFRGYRPGEIVGQSGVEATYDRVLRGGLARTRVSVDSRGGKVGVPEPLRSSQPPPRRLELTVDMRLQRAAVRAIRHGIALAHAAGHRDAAAGAAVVLDPRTGALLALASYPGFNQVAAASEPTYLLGLSQGANPSKPLFDRAIQGLYPAGSTFKPIVAEAALATGVISASTILPCTGSLTVGDTVFHNVEPAINAALTLPQAVEISCDTWFYRVGLSLYANGGRGLQRWAGRLGIGRTSGIDLPGEAAGQLPLPRYPGDSVNLSIGQGKLLVTPLQIAVAYAALANGGTLVRPHVGGAVLSPSGHLLRRLKFPPRARLHLVGLPAIRDGLYRATHDPGGTSSAVFATFPIPVAGKTGTAETPGGSDDSWFASWAPAAKPRLVVVVLIEHGGFGAEAAAPAARDIYAQFFGKGT